MSGLIKRQMKHTLCDAEHTTVDILIVGAGLAGLHSALQLSARHPKAKIIIAEAYNYTGGRVLTYKPKGFPGIQWEMGAGRIHQSHHRILSYADKYGLHSLPLSETQIFISKTKESVPDRWPSVASATYSLLHNLKPEILATHTIDSLVHDVAGPESEKALLTFPYYAENHVLRADKALHTFQNEMGSTKHYVVIKEGLSAIINEMVNELKERGVSFLFGHRLVDVDHKHSKATFANGCTLHYKTIILALHSVALKQIPLTQTLPALQHIVLCPLLRIYAIFETKKGKSWFSDLPKVVTDSSPLRFIIPINPQKGVIMISYTDASDTEYWTDILETKGLDALQTSILKEVRALFPDRDIPEPLYLKPHHWTEGCSYWLPGRYSMQEMSESVLNPFPNVYICNESFSVNHQCWMEGALEHADAMLERFSFHI